MAEAIPEAKPGLVFRYDYLWSRDAAAGRNQGKDRPACIVVAGEPSMSPHFVVILPITHTPPSGDTVAFQQSLDATKRSVTASYRRTCFDR